MDELEINLAESLGAGENPLAQRLTLYIPNKDSDDRLIIDHERWITEARDLLTHIGGGTTAFPPVDGTWKSPDGSVIWETTRIIYTFIDPELFKSNLQRLREFLHRFGRETKQGEVVVEFDGSFFRISQYDASKKG